MTFEWKETCPPALVRDEKDLASVIDAAAKEASPARLTIANLYADNGDALSIVLGGPETVVSFTYGHGNPPYYVSRGEDDNVEPVLTCYLFMTHHTEFRRRHVIPMERGLAAAHEFLQTGRRPEVIEWDEN